MDTQALALALPFIGWASHTALLTHRLATARRDPLTGLRTRAGWTALAERVIRRHPDAVVLLLDLDDFKHLNDTHGHAAGDFALVVTAERVSAWCGRHGIAGRLGGDEFVAIARRAPDLDSLHRALSHPVAYAGHRLPVSVSVGCCQVKDLPVRSLSDALTAADCAMYADKGKAGRRGTRRLSR
ncbi:diguanylate cyclase (GGDEF) domain-containing protein [Streptomyces sp. 136MFCol5.1]|uniref:GGDEF domain-containing protein n=1 Tax=Streptomyces sp. 136MFCol5.1 TaxID=1172182 RepID=UPI00088EAA6B|nr:GGDEF domain-containing protein [Streptomyces sp. 136MFCol5.1]SCY86625.1 diguanylate cyclase (GGDEF) domain-containing protein [Streptomyces sp. 136MFCol5.1]